MAWKLLAALAILTLMPGSAALGAPLTVGPLGPPDGPLRQQTWLIPSPAPGTLMYAELFRPRGNGPYPLAVINHGTEEDNRARAEMPPPAFPALTAWLVRRGYAVVLPQRPGHGRTGGPYLEAQGRCGAPDYVAAGQATATSIAATIAYFSGQPFIKREGALVFGNSAGGWGALALAAQAPQGVAAAISFAGGRGGRDHGRANHNCAPDRLVAASAQFGRTDSIPTLWLYAANDSYFAPDLATRLSQAFVASGGHAEFHLLPAIPGDGHGLINDAQLPWAALLAAFLDRVGG